MGLSMPNKTAVQSVAQPVQPAVVPQQPSGTVLLELSLYKRYTRHGRLFLAGNIYRFSNEQAIRLLGEHDRGRPIWRRWRVPAPKVDPLQKKVDGIIDATAEQIKPQPEGDPLEGNKPGIQIGNDDEILSILNGESDKEGAGDLVV